MEITGAARQAFQARRPACRKVMFPRFRIMQLYVSPGGKLGGAGLAHRGEGRWVVAGLALGSRGSRVLVFAVAAGWVGQDGGARTRRGHSRPW